MDLGERKLLWVERFMPVLRTLRAEFERTRPFSGLTIAIALHLEAKTAYLADTLRAGGAEVYLASSNPLSTQDDVARAVAARGVRVFARRGATQEEYEAYLEELVRARPHLLVDDGGDLVHLLHTRYPEIAASVIGGAEETTTGILRLRALARSGRLRFPMVLVNDTPTKHLFDNRYGTGQSVWDAFVRTTNLLVAGKTVVVHGYGWCGKGVAQRARGLGAEVVVTEVHPVRALEAHLEGFRVLPALEAAAIGDVFVTVTGNARVLGREHFARMKDGAFLMNAGHFDVEVAVSELREMAVRIDEDVRPNVDAYVLPDGRTLYLLGKGRLVNLVAGDGHPAEIMDLSFALQALSLLYLRERHAREGRLAPELLPVPPEVDEEVARRKLAALGIAIDHLTEDQRRYLEGEEA
ncbi:adenosylhomocysteinase [Brockia lithotrophica]|uniref:Adenosylhomocysteinase n=1 Tax=Brockia lithotrophica TaxID=933949 RepID=A0A660L3J2_9BACL|nr:adenosylhomocysteinase [Brockia lithotrophica]RKQ88476.1 adenosylhomocysteinase [Brockia lithotrophica]